jgi:hypothetical protein
MIVGRRTKVTMTGRTVYADDRTDICTSKENTFLKWFGKRPKLEMTLISLTTLRLGLAFSYFLMTLLALLSFFPHKHRHPGHDGD